MKTNINPFTAEYVANSRATGAAIDDAVDSGEALAAVIARYKDGQLFWLESARPFSKALSA